MGWPAEVLWYNNKAHLIRKRETFEDILNNQIEVDFSSKKEKQLVK
jgi:diaminopimelate decarboxylase